MYNYRAIPRLGLVDPYWAQRSIFKEILICCPLLEGGGEGTLDIANNKFCAFSSGTQWAVNEDGHMSDMDQTWIDLNLSSSVLDCTNMTWAIWANSTSTDAITERLVRVYTDINNSIFMWRGYSPDRINFNIKSAGVAQSVYKDNSIWNDGKNHLWTGTVDKNGINIYFDGKLEDTGGVPGAGTHTATLQIGTNNTGYKGNFSSTAIWNRGLSEGEVRELYELGPKFGLCEPGIDIAFNGALPAGAQFNAAFAMNSNQVL